MGYFTDKLSRNECFVHDCTQAICGCILWKCPKGHRLEVWRCAEHLAESTTLIMAGESGIPLCDQCPERFLMSAVFEGTYFPPG